MTYCVGIRVKEGLVALADGRVTTGSQMASARKVSLFGEAPNQFFIMTSGLRSVRDKVLAYLTQEWAQSSEPGFNGMLDAVGAFTECLRRVAVEDEKALAKSDLTFNLHAIIGGQLKRDGTPTMFLVYPEGNWIEVDERTPYLSIGATTYGKPILDRALRYDTEIRHALKLAYLSFDSTRFSSTDVGFPIDMLCYTVADRVWREDHFAYDDLVEQRQWWNQNLTELAERMPDGPWLDSLLVGSDDRFTLIRASSSDGPDR
ncbi:MAG: peptidase [Pseudomonadota bacterium]